MTLRHSITGLGSLAVCAVLLLSRAAVAQEIGKVVYDIPAQLLEKALTQFAVQSRRQLVFDPDTVPVRTAPEVKGAYTPLGALDILIGNSGLVYTVEGKGTIVVRRIKTAAGSDSVSLAQGQSSNPSPAAGEGARRVDEGRQKIEEIVVTAQKRSERLIDVPISVVALSSEELQERRVHSIDDLAMAVPGLAIQTQGATQRRIMLRGMSNNTGNSSLIGLYLDEASVTSFPGYNQLDLQTIDLERVEVLRGPQGTLYGEGSVGGTVRFITKDPRLDRFEWNASLEGRYTEDGAPGARAESTVNIPLVRDTLGLRVAGVFDRDGGWIDQPAAGVRDYNDQHLGHVRAKLLWRPLDALSIDAMVVHHHNHAPPNKGEDANGNFTQVFHLTATPDATDDYNLYNLTGSYDFSAARLLSTSTYVDQHKEQFNGGFVAQLTPPGTPLYNFYRPLIVIDGSIFTQELRLTSIGQGRWQWTVGGYYRDTRFTNDGSSVFALPGPVGTPLPLLSRSRSANRSKSWAGFADSSFKLTDRFTIGAGVRSFRDEQSQTNIVGTSAPVMQTGTFNSFNPRVYLQYRLVDDVNAYASAAKGFRSGGFNALGRPPYDPEHVWTYELGTKASLLQGRLYADAALFYSDYRGYQISGILLPPAPPLNIVSNAGNARIKGVEWMLSWHPLEQWTLAFNGDYLHSEFYQINATSTAYAVGDPLDQFPKYALSASVQRDFSLGGRAAFLRLDYSRQGPATYRNRHASGPTPWYFSESDIIDMLNLNAHLQWNEHVSFELFARNLLNDRGYVDPLAIEQFAARSRPRNYGVEVAVSF